ncbi:MAG: carbon starvation CstA family protein, partial [Muribaculaceae bacterium]|nr:carbon starvation CstA family protein [Muribaculaceae bacterium]
MISFVIALSILVAGYFTYGKFVARVFGADPARKTPVHTMADGVDYVVLPTWKIFLIQFLNIAGLGPIFGAIMGIMYGPAAFLWIVFGTIFAGAVHDYLSGMLSIRQGGASLPEIVGGQLGGKVKNVMRVFALLLMILVGAVFVYNPADLLAMLTPSSLDRLFWIIVIFCYYMAATLLPVDKLIGKLYPLFGVALLFMAVGIMVMLFVHAGSVPEIWQQFYNHKPDPEANPIFPMMFVSIACGAISGFHATQSPMMARCLSNEKYARPVFYGAMVAEGIVALIWAAAAVAFTGGYGGLQEFLGNGSPALLVDSLSRSWLGTFGGILAILGVIAAPITSGDTALRSARLIAADFMGIKQKKIAKRLAVSVPIFALCFLIML